MDKKNQKFGEGETLNKVDLEKLPDYIIYNKENLGLVGLMKGYGLYI